MRLGNRVVSQSLVELGRRIRNRRLDLHFSQEGIAEKLGMSVNTVSRIEGGQTAMSIEVFMKFMQVLKMDANELLSGVSLTKQESTSYPMLWERVQKLKQGEQVVVQQVVEALVEGLVQYR